MPAPLSRTDSTLVIGLGRFGSAVAATLDRLGREVLAVEANPATVREWTGRIPARITGAVSSSCPHRA